jgi:antitoxin (DNA-binding transcriptional repressor) of toxin-antitoxin stability system
MRQISIQEFEQDPKACLAEVEAGHGLTLLRGGKPVVDISPASDIDDLLSGQVWKTEDERLAAGAELMNLLRTGFDLGGLRIENRDELYERD